VAGIYLEVLSGTDRAGEVLRLAGRSFLIGRGAGCEVRVESDLSSREHALLALHGDAWVIRDRNSRNGTWLNGKRITEASLRPLDEIVIGMDGPALRVVTMDPAPPITDGGEDPARVLRLHRAPPAGSPPPEVRPVPPAPASDDRTPPAEPLSRPPPARAELRRMPPIFALLGLAFAASVALGVLGTEFPYESATAPILWCMAALRYLAPHAVPDPGSQLWVFRGLVALYGLVAGFALQRPVRRIVVLVALTGVHLLAALAL
jgi:hypothetical protein